MAPKNYSTKAIEWRKYHKVNARDLKNHRGNQKLSDSAGQEIVARIAFTRKYYGGKSDARHMRWMLRLKPVINLSTRIDMPLSALSVLQNLDTMYAKDHKKRYKFQ